MRKRKTYAAVGRIKTKVINVSTALVMTLASIGGVLPLLLSGQASAATTVVTPSDTQGWGAQDGTPTYVAGPSGADGYGSLKLTTDTQSKQNYFHGANTPLAAGSGLGYTVDVTAGVPASYQLQVTGVHRTDSTSTFTSLVWEPVYNGQTNGPNGGFVTESNLENGTWWSSHPIAGDPDGNNGFVSLSQIQAANPDATIVAYGVNVGSGTPDATSYVDDVSFQSNMTNFETDAPAGPTNLGFHYTADDQHDNGASLSCGAVVNSNKPSTYHTGGSLNLNWTAPSGDITAYQVQTTYPDGTPFDINNDGYQGPNAWSWLSFTHGEGTYTYSVRARNTAGQWSPFSNTCSVVYDKTAPVVTVTPAAGSLLSGTVTFDITVTDGNLTHNGTKTWVYLYDNGGTQKSKGASVDLSNGHGTFTVDTTLLDDGAATLDVGKLYDAAGNASGTGDTYFKNYTIDNTAPAVPTGLTLFDASNHQITSGYTNSYNVTAKWNGVGDATHYMYKYWNDIPSSAYDGEAHALAWSVPTNQNAGVFNQGEGTHYIAVSACDTAGNCSAYSSPLAVVYDATAPMVHITAPAANSTVHGIVTVSGTVSDVNPDHYYFVVKDSQGHVVAGPGTVNQATVADWSWNTKNVADGVYTIDLEARDKADNKGAGSVETITVTVDNSAPTGLSNLSPDNGAITTTAGLTHVDWTDGSDASGPVSYFYEVSNSPATNPDGSFVTTAYQSGALSASEIPTPNTPAGVYYWHVRAIDSQGNTSGWTDTWSFTIDNTAPVVDITGYGANGNVIQPTVTVTESSPVSYLWTPTDPKVTVSDPTANNPTFTALADGTYTFTLTATDAAGNTGSDSFTFTYTKPAPTLAPTTTTPFTGVVAGATTGTNGNTTNATTPLTDNGTGTTTPQVKGASTDKSNTDTKSDSIKLDNAHDKGDAFLGLGWWWLLILAIVAGFFFLLGRRRASSDNEA